MAHAGYKELNGLIIPNVGDRLVHKTMGYRGVFQGKVETNRIKNHFQVLGDNQKQPYVLPARDWIYEDDENAQADD